jgi:hypothetical protein
MDFADDGGRIGSFEQNVTLEPDEGQQHRHQRCLAIMWS